MSPTPSHVTEVFSSIRDDSQRVSEDSGSLSDPHLQNLCSQASTLLITLSEHMPAQILSHCICYSLTTHSEDDEHLFVYHSQNLLSSSSSWRHIPHNLCFLWGSFFSHHQLLEKFASPSSKRHSHQGTRSLPLHSHHHIIF